MEVSMNILDWIYRAIMTINVGTHKGEDIDLDRTYTQYANPNATNSELDAKKVIYHNREDHADL
tara:strand:- start:936 stop:1127 length:192 start_codon:yes stop_codon:yes gene_type:complete